MTEPQPVDPRDEGRRRAEMKRAWEEASAAEYAAMSMVAGRQAHRAVSADLRAAHQGLFPGMSPEDRGAANQERDAIVGSAFGGHQQLRRLGRLLDWRSTSDSPAPRPADLRYVGQPGQRPTGESPLAAFMRTRNN